MRFSCLLFCLAIVAAGTQAQRHLSVGSPPGAARRVPAAGTARPGIASAGARGTQKAARPASALTKDVSLAGKPCVYTLAVIGPIFYEDSDFTAAAPITACNDVLLSPAQQAACARCIGITRRDECLATVSDTYWGVDQHSCTWVGGQAGPKQSGRQGGNPSSYGKVTEARFSHGIALPWQQGMWLGSTTCSVRVKLELTNPAAEQFFPTAMFTFQMLGQDSSGAQLPVVLTSSSACTLKPGRKVCELTLVRPAYLKKKVWLSVRRDIYSIGPKNAAVEAWQRTGLSCLDYYPDAANCSALPAQYNYNYSLRISEERCKPFARPVTQGRAYQETPFGEDGALMWPSGDAFLIKYSLGYYAQGARTLEWDVRVLPQQAPTVPMFVAVMKEGDWMGACTETPDMSFKICDYSRSSGKALAGSACYARRCKGRIDFGPLFKGPAPSNVYLVVSYLRFTRRLDQQGVVNATETPPQTVAVSMVAAR